MASVFDVALYILRQKGPMSAMKLQKLVYYSQAWSLVWDEEPLFSQKIRAWANGPVVYELFKVHQGQFQVDTADFSELGSTKKLSHEQKETIDAVLKFYGDKTPQWLSDLTHMERPWKHARKGLPADAPGNQEITLDSMAAYYERISPAKQRG